MSDACAAYSFRADSTADVLLAVLLLSVPAALVALCVRDPLTQLQIACNALISVAAYFAVVKLIPMCVTRRTAAVPARRWLASTNPMAHPFCCCYFFLLFFISSSFSIKHYTMKRNMSGKDLNKPGRREDKPDM